MWISNLSVPAFDPGDRLTYTGERRTSAGIYCRDPFLLRAGERYYLYHSGGRNGILCSVSEDLENWSEPVTVFRTPENFHGIRDFFWAPECHYYGGNFYLFTSVFSSLTGHRSISVYRSADPLGPFTDIAGGCISPRDWDAIDGTLYVDEAGQPWMIFVHEWTCMPDGNGGMAAARLAEDFTHLISEPIELFRARDLPFAAAGVTDGPYPYRTDGGVLYLLWSNFAAEGYIVASARSDNGRLDGNWIQNERPVYRRGDRSAGDRSAGDRKEWIFDGGHSMLVPGKDGGFLLSFHSPNAHTPIFEHLTLLPVTLNEDGIFL